MIKKGFTLIELIVSISIITILIALIIPAIQKVRKTSENTICINNLKQMTLGLLIRSDTKKYLPRQTKVLQKPSRTSFYLITTYNDGKIALGDQYQEDGGILSILMCKSADFKATTHYGINYLINQQKIREQATSRWLAFADSYTLSNKIKTDAPVVSPLEMGNGSWAIWSTEKRHCGLFNCSFFDGHVETLENIQSISWNGID